MPSMRVPILCLVVAASLLGCKKNPSDKESTPGSAAPAPAPFTGPLTADLIMSSAHEISVYTPDGKPAPFASALAAAKRTLGEPTHVDGTKYAWGIVEAGRCVYYSLEDKSGTAYSPGSVAVDATDKDCLRAIGKAPPPPPDPANYIVVKPAFSGTVPKLPQLSRDGATAAVDLSVPIQASPMASFEVGFLSDRGKLERVAVLDHDTAAKLATDPATKVDTAAKSASSITKRLADDAFSTFATSVDPGILTRFGAAARTKGEDLPIPIEDKAKLVVSVIVNKSGPTSLRLRLDNAKGKKLTEQLVPGVSGDSSNSNCMAAPRLGGVWYDTARKRLLLRVEYMTADCAEIPPAYYLWKLP